ncbi:hypothetical protein DMENIID0001_004370 [Sergentomyia squamirostris]
MPFSRSEIDSRRIQQALQAFRQGSFTAAARREAERILRESGHTQSSFPRVSITLNLENLTLSWESLHLDPQVEPLGGLPTTPRSSQRSATRFRPEEVNANSTIEIDYSNVTQPAPGLSDIIELSDVTWPEEQSLVWPRRIFGWRYSGPSSQQQNNQETGVQINNQVLESQEQRVCGQNQLTPDSDQVNTRLDSPNETFIMSLQGNRPDNNVEIDSNAGEGSYHENERDIGHNNNPQQEPRIDERRNERNHDDRREFRQRNIRFDNRGFNGGFERRNNGYNGYNRGYGGGRYGDRSGNYQDSSASYDDMDYGRRQQHFQGNRPGLHFQRVLP